jgi:arginyl-tRNA synthetase
VKLQAYDESCIKAWKAICEVSRNYFKTIYQRLGITLQEFGESYYNPFIAQMLK